MQLCEVATADSSHERSKLYSVFFIWQNNKFLLSRLNLVSKYICYAWKRHCFLSVHFSPKLDFNKKNWGKARKIDAKGARSNFVSNFRKFARGFGSTCYNQVQSPKARKLLKQRGEKYILTWSGKLELFGAKSKPISLTPPLKINKALLNSPANSTPCASG